MAPTPLSKPRAFRRGYAKTPDNWSALTRVMWGAPVVVEVGCGTGDWICTEAPQNPTTYYIGIEQTEIRSDKLIQCAADIPNLVAIRADAVLLLDALCPPASVDTLYLFYPNPYPKTRQANRRLVIGPSMWVFDRCLKPGGTIYLATNIESYANDAAQLLTEAWGYTLTRYGIIDTQISPRTAFEKKYLERGEACFEVIAQKIL